MRGPIDLERLSIRVQNLPTGANIRVGQHRYPGWTRADVVAHMLPIADGDVEAARRAREASLVMYGRDGSPDEGELEDGVRSEVADLFGVGCQSDEVERRENGRCPGLDRGVAEESILLDPDGWRRATSADRAARRRSCAVMLAA